MSEVRPWLQRVDGDRYRLCAASGEDFAVHDFKLVRGRRRVVRLGSTVATYRAFVPAAGAPVRVYRFRDGDRHTPDVFDLELQLASAEYLGERYDTRTRQAR